LILASSLSAMMVRSSSRIASIVLSPCSVAHTQGLSQAAHSILPVV